MINFVATVVAPLTYWYDYKFKKWKERETNRPRETETDKMRDIEREIVTEMKSD